MAIADRVEECINKYNANDLENALIQICIALDGTAKKEFPKIKKVGERFKAFVKKNIDIITFFTFNTNMFIDCQFGDYTIEHFTYKVLRCGLLHEGEIPYLFEFAEPGQPVFISDTKWCFPKTFIFGTLLAVIGAETNCKQNLTDTLSVTIMGQTYKVNDLWGRADIIRQKMEPSNA